MNFEVQHRETCLISCLSPWVGVGAAKEAEGCKGETVVLVQLWIRELRRGETIRENGVGVGSAGAEHISTSL